MSRANGERDGRSRDGRGEAEGRQGALRPCLLVVGAQRGKQYGALLPPHHSQPKPASPASTICAPGPSSRAEAGLKGGAAVSLQWLGATSPLTPSCWHAAGRLLRTLRTTSWCCAGWPHGTHCGTAGPWCRMCTTCWPRCVLKGGAGGPLQMCVLYLDWGEQSGWELAWGAAAGERKERMHAQQLVALLALLLLCFCFRSARAQAGTPLGRWTRGPGFSRAGGPRRLGRNLVLSFPPP